VDKGAEVPNPDKPFFVYYAAQGMHDRCSSQTLRDKYKGQFNEGGQVSRRNPCPPEKLGIVPENTQLTPARHHADWDTPADEKKVAIATGIFAAFAEVTDYEMAGSCRPLKTARWTTR
jgi:arylsulfatase